MSQSLQYFLPIYVTVFFFIAIVYRTGIVWYKNKQFPIFVAKNDDIRRVVGVHLHTTLILLILVCYFVAIFPDKYFYLAPITYLDDVLLKCVGFALLICSLSLVAIAQAQMGKSWRIGIDDDANPGVVNTGIYKISRNPIYLGMILTLLGIFLVIPNAITLLILGVCYVLFQVQIRLEEQYMLKTYQDEFLYYIGSTRRWI